MDFVSIIIGSKSDHEIMQECAAILRKFEVPFELIISSAHRSPERTKAYVQDAERRGAKLFVCAAGMAAHLAGAVASMTIRPVIGVPMGGGAIGGIDALLSTVQMPAGMPVGTVAIGKAGAINAAYLAIQTLAIQDATLAEKLRSDRALKVQQVESDSEMIEVRLA